MERRRLNTIREEEEEDKYQGRRIEEGDEEDEMGQMGDIINKL